MSEQSLRERSRARRRAAIESAALRLFAERGYDATTLAQVAEEAEVAPRTVSMHFPSKLHLALSYTTAAAQRLADAIASRGRDESALIVITAWLRTELDRYGEEMGLAATMLRANPEIRGAETPELTEAKARVTAALAADLGRDEDDVVVSIAGGAFAGVIDAIVQLGPERADPVVLATASRTLDAVMRAATRT